MPDRHGPGRRLLDRLADAVAATGCAVGRDRPLGPLTTYRVGGPAALLVEVPDEDALGRIASVLSSAGPEARAVPILVVGRGSNMLVADAGFCGLALHLGGGFASFDVRATEPGEAAVVRAGAALDMPVLARRSVDAGLTGMEWAVGIPGSVGGAVAMNAGGHGSDMAARLVRYRWMDLGGSLGGREDAADRLALGYRSSALAAGEVVIWAEVVLRRGDPELSRAELREIVRWRRANQPGGSNAGSVFTNPEGDSAGRLVEAAGCKGLRMGTAAVSTKHANFIQADPGGSATDVHRLMEHVRRAVHRHSGTDLVPEVRLIGFDDRGEGT